MREWMCPQLGWTCRKTACVCTQTLKHCHMLAVSIANPEHRPQSVARNLIWGSFPHKMTTLVRAVCVLVLYPCENLFQTVCEVSACVWKVGTSTTATRCQLLRPAVLTQRTKWLVFSHASGTMFSCSVHHFFTEISQQLQDGLPCIFAQTCMVPKQWILMALMIPLLFL